jgi:transcriptional regulator with XRE-family HTH domain
MAKNFNELRRKMSPEALARSDARVKELLAEMPLDELREARRLTQEQLAEQLGVGQSHVSKLERRADMYVSTLGRIIEAMGGQLEMHASFPDGDVPIKRFSESRENRRQVNLHPRRSIGEEAALADRIVRLHKNGQLPTPFGVADIRKHFQGSYAHTHIRTVLANYCETGDQVNKGREARFRRRARGKYVSI